MLEKKVNAKLYFRFKTKEEHQAALNYIASREDVVVKGYDQYSIMVYARPRVIDQLRRTLRVEQLYKCDYRKNYICSKTDCYQHGGLCSMTTDKRFELKGGVTK